MWLCCYQVGDKFAFLIGNVEAVAVARSAVDKDRAVGSNSAAYLSSLDADERLIKGIHVDDPKAIFLFRWYQEADGEGKVLSGFQNKSCKVYYLTLDNGSFPFEWVSNLQVISVVHLKPHVSKNRTFTLSAGDIQDVDGSSEEDGERTRGSARPWPRPWPWPW